MRVPNKKHIVRFFPLLFPFWPKPHLRAGRDAERQVHDFRGEEPARPGEEPAHPATRARPASAAASPRPAALSRGQVRGSGRGWGALGGHACCARGASATALSRPGRPPMGHWWHPGGASTGTSDHWPLKPAGGICFSSSGTLLSTPSPSPSPRL